MGNKNRIVLGILTASILHHCRNMFNGDELVVSKKKALRIEQKHPEQAHYILQHSFQMLLDATIATYNYKEDGIINFITHDGQNYLLYGVSTNNYRNELSTIFKPSIRQLRKCQSDIRYFKSSYKEDLLEYIKN